MKKSISLTLGLLGCALLAGGAGCSIAAYSKIKDKNIDDLNVYTAYVQYRNNGGTKTYIEWVKDGSIPKPKDIDRAIYEKGKKGIDVVSAEIDDEGYLVLRLSNGEIMKTAIPKLKWHTVNFYIGDLLFEKKQIIHGKKIEFPHLDFDYDDGWYLDKELKERWDVNKNVVENFNLYANIDLSKKYDVTLVDEEFEHIFAPLKMSFGSEYELPRSFDMNSEYDFTGWEVANEKDHSVAIKGKWKILGDVTLKAKWAKKTGIKANEDGLYEFGLFPQSKVTIPALHNRIANSIVRSKRGNPIVDGYEYFFTQITKSYYRFEPLTWVLLNDGDNGENGYRFVTRDVIDASPICSKANGTDFYQTSLYSWLNNYMRTQYLVLGSLESGLIKKLDPNGTSDATVDLLSRADYRQEKLPTHYRTACATDFALKEPIYSYDEKSRIADWWQNTLDNEEKKDWYAAVFYGEHTVRCDQNLGLRPVIRVASIEQKK